MKSCLVFLLAAVPATAFAPSPAGTAADGSRTALFAARADREHAASRRAVLTTSLAGLAGLAAPPAAFAIETYLTEPTDDFKESERQRMEFRKKQLVLKGEFVKVLARFTTESKTEDELIRDLTALRELVVQTEGLPLGIKKEEMYKVIRSVKAKGFWPTNVEIA